MTDAWEQADRDWAERTGDVEEATRTPTLEPLEPRDIPPEPPRHRPTSNARIETRVRPAFDGRDTGEILLEGQRAVEENLEAGYEIFLVAGITASGKTQLLEAFGRLNPGFLNSHDMQEDDKQVKRTTEGSLDIHCVPLPGRPVAFLDAPGELFEKLLPSQGKIAKHALQLPNLIAKKFHGLVLAFDLEKYWSEDEDARAEGKRQIKILAWILEVMRWARHRGTYPVNTAIPLDRYITQETRTMKRRLDVPVLVLFTKADELRQQPIPGFGDRRLRPEREQPLFFAQHCLPDLYGALMAHADHFHFDFVHSIVSDPESGVITDLPPCGIRPAFDWLLDPAWQRSGRIPSQLWLAFQEWLDGFTGKRHRWIRLPAPERMPK